jgi:uncharacterized membrane protein YdjX (TVP38/TMEM64 family)
MKALEGLRRRGLWWSAVGMAALAAIVALLVPAQDWSELLRDALRGRALHAALLLFCAAYVVGTMLLLPAWIFPIAAGAAFGIGWGIAASAVSSVLSAVGAFLVARYLLRAPVERAAQRHPAFGALSRAVEREPFKVIALLRLSPVLTSGMKSYFLGLMRVRTAPYALASAVGMLPGIVLKVYVGHAGRGVLEGGGPLKWAMLAVGVAATIAMAVVVGKAVRRKLGF